MPESTAFTRRQLLQLGLTGYSAYHLASPGLLRADDSPRESRSVPAVPGELKVETRRRVKVDMSDGQFEVVEEATKWRASETAIIICDMWSDHPCKLAAQRVARMAPRMNEVVSLARDHGVAVIHAPSGGVKHYEDSTYRLRMKEATFSKPPVPIQRWCYLNKEVEAALPIVDNIARAKGAVTGCDDPQPRPQPDHDRHQHPAIKIIGYDGISDDGQEIFNFLEQEQRKNIVLMGVHTNMCVLGRPFGIRQMKYLGKNVVLCRDLTDALYDPRDRPHVSHTRGVELVIEHIEKYWCPSIVGKSLNGIVPGSAGGVTRQQLHPETLHSPSEK